ncbi:Canalicular multispecific organic anion transporter 2, variant 2 [Lathyrus oleraceus]|uniref:Canalicular multispecific organic anion transporter 2, variant 2 n=1 Tax=Pisum sativum TaxID=3888 RepID=A0A9D5AEP5_PEA|nr:Canalicular multispecific organic anion transporter 2, variant 2 [Pisum sativum]
MSISNLAWGFTYDLVQLLGIIAVMSQAAWQVFIVLIPVMAACIWYQRYYSASARELARLTGICQAPVIQHFSETISGSTTISCFEQESRFNETNMQLIDKFSQPKLYSASAMEWLSFRLDLLSSTIFAFCLAFLVSFPSSIADPRIAGLAVTYGINLNAVQSSLISILCNLENKIISVERILQYTSIPSEAPFVIKDNQPDHSWPSFGEVHIQDLQVQYAPHLPLVLRGLTCTFTAGAKTGIVGRTGSGKTTLVQALFRLVEPLAGKILIDNINISSIGVHDLRSRLSIIPQDPTMFEGTVRSNLDPLEEYTDEQIWEVKIVKSYFLDSKK